MVDLGIARTQDIQNPLPASAATGVATPQPERGTRPSPMKSARRAAEEAKPAELRPADLDAEVLRLNELLGQSTRIRFVINRTTNDVYVEVVDKESNKVIRTVPPSEITALAGKLSGGGLLVDNLL